MNRGREKLRRGNENGLYFVELWFSLHLLVCLALVSNMANFWNVDVQCFIFQNMLFNNIKNCSFHIRVSNIKTPYS